MGKGIRDKAKMIAKHGRLLMPGNRGTGYWAKPSAEHIAEYKEDYEMRTSHQAWKDGDWQGWDVPNDSRID